VHEKDVGVLVLAEFKRLSGALAMTSTLYCGYAFSNAGISTSKSPES